MNETRNNLNHLQKSNFTGSTFSLFLCLFDVLGLFWLHRILIWDFHP